MESFRLIPGESSVPRFEIKLRVTNPNKQSLDIAGISYSIDVLDKKLLSGVTNSVPVIEGYSDTEVLLEADLQWLQLLRLVTGLAQEELKPLDYQFSAKIDFNGFWPTQRIQEQGTFDFTQGNIND
jgi:LEA14-like dessication related protein